MEMRTMAGEYLAWLTDMFEEAQVPLNSETEDYLDRALHRIAGVEFPQRDEGQVYRALQLTFLKLGPPGRQLLAAYIRDEAFARRDSPMRPAEGVGYYTNAEYEGQD
jgi:hypothetical protein